MEEMYVRTAALLGEEAVEKLKRSRVAVFGVGGVGGHAAEALARCGVGHLTLVDGDVFVPSNLNRQLFAASSVLGMPKVDAAAARLRDVAPGIDVLPVREVFSPSSDFDVSAYDYVLDAIDTVTAKIELVARCTAAGVPVISSMGAGNKLDPTAFRVTAIEKTSGCPLARVMRRELKKRGITGVNAVWSPEEPLAPAPSPDDQKGTAGRPTPGSMAFVPSAAGLILAGEIVKDLLGETLRKGGERHG